MRASSRATRSAVHYDPMLAKLIVHATRSSRRIERLAWALDRFAVLGVATNIPLLRGIAGEDDYSRGPHDRPPYLDTHASRGPGD